MILRKSGFRPSTSTLPAHGTATCAGHALAAVGRGLLDGSVHAVGEEAEIAGASARIDDVEHFLRRAVERDRVLVRRHEIGRVVAVRVQPDALIGLVRRSDFRAELVAQLGDLVRWLCQTVLMAKQPDDAGVIGLDGQDARGRVQIGLVVMSGAAP